MTPEQIANLNRDKRIEREKKISDFIRKIETNGFVIDDYIKVTELTELVAKGEVGPTNQLNALINLKNQKDSFDIEKVSSDFRSEIRNDIELLVETMNKNTKAPTVSANDKDLTETQRFNKLVSNIKNKVGIVLADNRVDTAVASREETYQKIQNLSTNTTLSSEQKMAEYKRLLKIYNGANLDTIAAAKNITDRGNVNINIEYVEDLTKELNQFYLEVMMMNLDDNTKKAMIDNFSKVAKTCTKYKATISTNLSYTNRYDRLIEELGIKFNNAISKENENKDYEIKTFIEPETKKENGSDVVLDTENIFKASEIVVFNGNTHTILGTNSVGLELGKEYKVIDSKIINGINHYSLEGIDGLYESSLFDSKDLSVEDKMNNEDILNNEAATFNENSETIEPEIDELGKEGSEINIPEIDIPEIEEPENDLGDKVISVKDGKHIGLGTLTWKIIAISGIIAGASLSVAPITLISAIIWATNEYRDRVDIKTKKKFFPMIAKKIKNKIASSSIEVDNKDELDKLVEETFEENLEQNLDLDEDISIGMGK